MYQELLHTIVIIFDTDAILLLFWAIRYLNVSAKLYHTIDHKVTVLATHFVKSTHFDKLALKLGFSLRSWTFFFKCVMNVNKYFFLIIDIPNALLKNIYQNFWGLIFNESVDWIDTYETNSLSLKMVTTKDTIQLLVH